MKNALDRKFDSLRRQKKKALIAYLAAGYPAFREEQALVTDMVLNGVDVIEIGIPFSDPIADGPTIQFASQQALDAGVTVPRILKWIRELQKSVSAPIVVMTYLNPVLAYGTKKFAKDAAAAGVSGVIVPDMIPEESAEIRRELNAGNIHLIHLVAPTTPRERQATISKLTGGFLYAVSVAGVTGARRTLPKQTKRWLASLQRLSEKPVCVGFGISGPDQIRHLRSAVDGFIVGSAVIDVIRKNKAVNRKAAMKKFVTALAKECSNGR